MFSCVSFLQHHPHSLVSSCLLQVFLVISLVFVFVFCVLSSVFCRIIVCSCSPGFFSCLVSLLLLINTFLLSSGIFVCSLGPSLCYTSQGDLHFLCLQFSAIYSYEKLPFFPYSLKIKHASVAKKKKRFFCWPSC